jgi:maltose alpha-D-glucosyltransferase/alpha-amylase
MVRSFSYAAYAALFSFTHQAPDSYAQLEPWADIWQHAVSDAFVRSYRDALTAEPAATELVPDAELWTTLFRAFVAEKALYEVAYELNHRPEWIRVPLIGIRKLIG